MAFTTPNPLSVVTETDTQSTACGSLPASGSPLSGSSSNGSTRTSVSGASLMHGHRNVFSPSQAALTKSLNPEGSNNIPTAGWPTLAKMIADTPAFESFRRFRELNVKNLLYYQVELADLEAELAKVERRDARKPSDGSVKEGTFRYSADEMLRIQTLPVANERERLQCDLILKIRERLREYNAALLQHAQVSALPHPESDDVENLRVWMKRTGCGNTTMAVQGRGSKTWGDIDQEEARKLPLIERVLPLVGRLFVPRKSRPEGMDLVALQPRRSLDGLTRWVAEEWIPFFNDCWNRKRVTEASDPRYDMLQKYSKSTMLKFTSLVATVIACLLPTLAIGILTTAETNAQKLGYIGGFTALFSVGLIWLTDAGTSRVQIFTATAAFSAVLVVFVQNQ